MRPYYEAVASEGFAHLAVPLQFAALMVAIAQDYPTTAATLRQIEDGQRASTPDGASRPPF